jgi:inorganic pyrophosphatase|tara:strand:- start:4095 stop:4721 length:627 start_codon:yes stop_codon:yes gene_type:complete
MRATVLLLLALTTLGAKPETRCGLERSCLTISPFDHGGSVQMVVEIPTGTIEKWEMSKIDGKLYWEKENDVPRLINYLAYPGNYGFVPGTLLDETRGGDGDPLDVILLGPAIARGSIVSITIVSVLKLMDSGERDDKLIAVPFESLLSDISNIEDMRNGMKEILETWFENYKGSGLIESLGFQDRHSARKILENAVQEYEQSRALSRD